MPLTIAAPCPQAVSGNPCGCSALNALAPAVEFAVSAASAFCGSVLPEIQPINVENASTAATTNGRSGEPAGNAAPIASAVLLPVCGLPIEVTEATRSGRTEAT